MRPMLPFLLLLLTGGPALAAAPFSPEEAAPVEIDDVPVPAFSKARLTHDREWRAWTIRALGDPDAPGHGATLWLYLPPGEHAPGSLPAVLVPAAGSTLLQGMVLADVSRREHLPYVQAGFAVVAFDIDGHPDSPGELQEFMEARGGLVNARNAAAFARELPMVDADRVFIAGHSSAGELALLYAAHDDDLAGAAAYNAPGDGCWYQRVRVLKRIAEREPGLHDFCVASRPRGHLEHLEVPVFLFGSDGDAQVPATKVRVLATKARRAGAEVDVEVGAYGDHYRSMLEAGIPAGIEWMRARSEGAPAEE